MYPVSSDYLSAVGAKTRTDRLTGSITLSGGREIPISDSTLVRGSLKLTRELCRSKYRIGTFNIACLRFSIFIDNALGLDLTGAYAELEYGILTGEAYEDVPLGKFFIDPVLSVRRKNILSIVAYDEGVKFEVQLSDTLRSTEATPDVLIAAACTECGVSTDITAASIASLPNSGLAVCPDDRQIQTCRDLIMWCAALMCCYASIDRSSKLVLIPAKYAVSPEDSTVIITNRTIRENERRSITVTDTRAYIKYLTAYAEDDVVSYTSSYVSTDVQAAPAAYVLEKNPLLSSCSRQVCHTANTAWLAYIDSFKQRGVNAEIFGDPAVDIGDTIAFRGGDVDQRGGIIGVVTGIEWCYRGCMIIECLAAECCGSLVGDRPAAISSNVRKQHRKRVDSPQAGSGSGVGEFTNTDKNSERFNDYTDNETAGSYDHIEGKNNESLSEPYSPPLIPDLTLETVNHMEGLDNSIAAGVRVSHVAGESNTLGAGSYACDIGGYDNTVGQGNNLVFVRGLFNNVSASSKTFVYCDSATAASADCSFVAGGYGNNISGTQGCLVSGYTNNCSGARYSMVGGQDNTVSGYRDLVGGYRNTVRGECDLAAGQDNTVTGFDSAALGYELTNTKNYCLMCGHEGSTASLGNVLFVVANSGIAFYIDDNGAAYAAGGYHAIGADYAEYFEWSDGNPDNEDRRGMLVSLDGDRIVPAHGDDILGAVSVRPSVVGNAYEEHWHGKYRTDAFGGYVLDENGKRQMSDDFDESREYIPRSQRPEWSAVGMVGRLIVTDDGRCAPGGNVSARHGIAVPTFSRTNVRCLGRIDDTHIEVLIK